MSRLYDTVEPSVVDEEMLQKAVEEQGPKEEAGRIAKAEGIDFADVESLRLDFKNILKIDNLWCFKSLVKLQLDNNIIEKVEGLEMLVNLVWLDLSFNNIEVIEGLGNLTKLEDLTLYNNRISSIKDMENLTNLHVFSIGNNMIKELNNTLYLRRFKKLQTVNLGGNPMCESEKYRLYVIAHLPALEYLDYRLIDENSKQAARDEYEISIQEIEHNEKQAQLREDDQATKTAELELHMAAYVDHLNGSYLFDAMYAEDAEGQKLAAMPGVDEIMIVYKERFAGVCQQIFELGLTKHEERMAEVNMFWECIADAKRDNGLTGVNKINSFMEYKKQLWQELSQVSEQKIMDVKVDEYSARVSTLWDELMALEIQLVDQLEEVIREFERNMSDMVSLFTESVQGLMTQCRDFENQHHEKLMEMAIFTLEKVVKNELDEDIPDDLKELFVDKDTIINAVSSSHDVHLLKIDNREDDIITRSNQWLSAMMETIHQTEEIERNRMRVTEINSLIDHLRDESDNLDVGAGQY